MKLVEILTPEVKWFLNFETFSEYCISSFQISVESELEIEVLRLSLISFFHLLCFLNFNFYSYELTPRCLLLLNFRRQHGIKNRTLPWKVVYKLSYLCCYIEQHNVIIRIKAFVTCMEKLSKYVVKQRVLSREMDNLIIFLRKEREKLRHPTCKRIFLFN